jgi:hypothetical protein
VVGLVELQVVELVVVLVVMEILHQQVILAMQELVVL